MPSKPSATPRPSPKKKRSTTISSTSSRPIEHQLFATLDGREIKRFDGRTEVLHTAGAEIDDYQPTARERIIDAVADPNVGFILLALGALGVYVEFSSPGLILPGVAGGILFLLGFPRSPCCPSIGSARRC